MEIGLKNKKTRLFLILGGFFICNALMAEFIGVKIFSLEKTLGIEPFNWTLFGEENISLNLTSGVLLWPVVFILTDIINEYFGIKGVRLLSFLAAGLIIYSFIMVTLAMEVSPANFWISSKKDQGVRDMNNAFNSIFGQGRMIIIGSITAFLVSQFLDAFCFRYIKKLTGEKMIWLRATGSTLISQFIDSFIVLYIAFYDGQVFTHSVIMALGTVGYIYKFIVAILATPVIYLIHYVIDWYLGTEASVKMRNAVLADK